MANFAADRIASHDSGVGWKGIDLTGITLTTRPYETPQLMLQYPPADL